MILRSQNQQFFFKDQRGLPNLIYRTPHKFYFAKNNACFVQYDEYSLVSGKVTIGDLLVTGVGTIGVPYLIRNSEPLYFKDGNIIWFQNGTKIDGDFFLYSFFGKAIQAFLLSCRFCVDSP